MNYARYAVYYIKRVASQSGGLRLIVKTTSLAFCATWKATRYSMRRKPHTGNWNWLFSHIEHHIRVTAGRSRGLGTKSTSEFYFRISRFQSLLPLSYFRYELHTATTGGSNLSQLSDMWRSTRNGNRAEITVLNPYSIWFFVPTQEISSIHLLWSISLHDCIY